MDAIHCFWEGHHNNCKSIPHNYNSTSTTNYILSNSSLFCIAIIIILQIYYFFIAIIACISNHDVQSCDFPFQHIVYPNIFLHYKTRDQWINRISVDIIAENEFTRCILWYIDSYIWIWWSINYSVYSSKASCISIWIGSNNWIIYLNTTNKLLFMVPNNSATDHSMESQINRVIFATVCIVIEKLN